jgi:hypothetical protein
MRGLPAERGFREEDTDNDNGPKLLIEDLQQPSVDDYTLPPPPFPSSLPFPPHFPFPPPQYLNEIDGRDTARCLAVEASGRYETHCVSLQDGSSYLEEKFLFANFNKETFVKQLKEKWCLDNPNPYTQIILDYFWIPPGWAEQVRGPREVTR